MAVPPPSSSAASAAAAKAEMRRAVLTARRAFVAAGPPPLAVPAPLRDLLDKARVVAGYMAMADEADPTPLLAHAHARGCTLALPHVTTRSAPMRFLRWAPGDPLEHGPMALQQPSPDSPDIEPDLLLIPLVAFDARGHRLGHGGGFYDCALAARPHARRIGIAWSVQQVPQVPVDAWDEPLHAMLTERDWMIPTP
ncbi:MAG: 5-formyltetrahydrofolate cyclo-ligase [Sphingomonas sp.]